LILLHRHFLVSMNYLPDAALFLLLVVALVSGGWAVSGREKSALEAAILPAAAFLGCYAFSVWVVGSLWKLVPGFWSILPWPLWLILLVWKRENVAYHARRAVSGWPKLPLDRALTFYLLTLFGLTFGLSLAPPGGADYDSLVYHLAVPAQYLRAEKVVELPYDHHSYFPFTLEMLYAVGLAARGEVFAKLFHWLMLPLGALALVSIGRRAHSARAGLLAAALYASMPMTLQEATTAYIDLGFAAFTFLALACFVGAPMVAVEKLEAGASPAKANQNLIWCGIFCGLCLGTKYFGWLIFGFLGLWLLISGLKNRTLTARQLACFALPALVLGLPWYLRNALWTGNPVFPFAYGVFGGQGWSREMATAYDASQASYGFGKSALDAMLLPFRLAMTPLNVGQFGGVIRGIAGWPLAYEPPAPGYDGLFEVRGLFFDVFPGPALLALGFPALVAPRKPRAVVVAASLFGFLWLFWIFTSQQIRYLLPALGILALVGGWGAAQFGPRLRVARWVGGLGLALWFGLAPAFVTWRAAPNFAVLSGAISGEDYLRRFFPGYAAMDWANKNTPTEAKFAVYGEPRCFYLDRAYFWADDQHNQLIDYSKLKSGADFARALRDLGATHVLWNLNLDYARNGGVYGPPGLIEDAIARGDLQLQLDENAGRGYRVYSLRTP
jgi:hypothetical protein